MKINKLKLYNFSSFEDLNEFDFTVTEDNKNIILIGGKNGAGKTSLFSAIKLALYGPLAFGYIAASAHYTKRIKEIINTKAYAQEHVLTYVTVELSIKLEREFHNYEITRSWDFESQKLSEVYSVLQDGVQLKSEELYYFENYLKTIIPPDLFDFFMFDGEAVGEIFSSESYNGYIRNALFTMCGLDTFEDIRRITSRYIAGTDEADENSKAYAQGEKALSLLHNQISNLQSEEAALREQQEALTDEITALESAFKNAGGISEDERVQMKKVLEDAEKVKAESAGVIKGFVEEQMPFIIISDLAAELDRQMELEEQAGIYQYINRKIDQKEIADLLAEYSIISYDVADIMIDYLQRKFKPQGYVEHYKAIHDLSREEKNRVNAMMSMLETFDSQKILDLIDRKQQASATTAAINKKLKNSMTEEDQKLYEKKHADLKTALDNIDHRLEEIMIEAQALKEDLEMQETAQNKLYQSIRDSAQNQHVYELSQSVAKIMESVLNTKTVSLREDLETKTVEKLHSLYRKDNLITHIEIRENYRFSLYQDQGYTETELVNLMQNLGLTGFADQIGKKGVQTLITLYDAETLEEVKELLCRTDSNRWIQLFKKIELSRLSKGERQIFILSLYWAMIELSGQEIPFIIDTPYARIDATHRREISEKFFPNISRQVIILSTDEEINEEYYEIVKPYIGKEYLLCNDMSENRTTIENRYFFGEN